MLRRHVFLASASVAALAGGALLGGSCSSSGRGAVARQIQGREDLIGGPGALGEVGDYLLANERVRMIVQGPGYSRGFGIYGGSLIDADLVRPATRGDSAGGRGLDNFSELFPGLFLKAMRPQRISVDNAEDGSAAVVVTGSAGDFIYLAQKINEALIDAGSLQFRNEYRLRPGKRYVEITTTVTNAGTEEVPLPNPGVSSLLGDAEFIFPVGDVILFGAGNEVFAEGAGFDLRFTLEALYADPVELPKLPGLVTPFLATKGAGISYGFMSAIEDPDASLVARAGYEGAAPGEMVVPFVASGFTGAYYGAAPAVLYPRGSSDGPSSFSFKKYFIVGSGDVASVRDVVHELREVEVGSFAGRVFERFGGAPEVGAEVVTFDAEGRAYNQHTAGPGGLFRGTYAPGRYSYRVLADGRAPTAPVEFEVTAGRETFLDVPLASPGEVAVRILAEDGRPMPGRCTLVAVHGENPDQLPPRAFLYDLSLGERTRPVDLVPDGADPATREYVEEVLIAGQGIAREKVRPGRYRAVCSRGMEYDLATRDVEVVERGLAAIDVTLPRAIDTRGWASGDYHLHSVNSVDSSMSLEARVAHVAAEGVDVACSSDHNFVTDYAQAIAGQGLGPWVQGMVGLELTTLEIGHFNGFPLRYDAEPITKGSFEWSGRPPAALFEDLRALGKHGPDKTIIQVNHPRDTILGYFNGYNWNPDTGEAEPASSVLLDPEGPEFGPEKFSYDFDAIEIYNAKRYELLRHYRVPEVLPPGPLPEEIPPAGTILRDEDGKVAYPGGLDDWFTLLSQGRVYTAMGNSDSHGEEDEPGVPRTYVPVSDDQPGRIDELEIVDAIQRQRALPTSGPFTRISVTGDGRCLDRRTGDALAHEGCGMGEVAPAKDGRVTVVVDTQVASWIALDRVTFILDGEEVATVRGDSESLAKVTRELEVAGDGWLVVEVAGSRSMFPVVLPRELPSIQVSNALGSIAGAFGFSLDPFGNLKPSEVTVAYPYAFTNPVFLDGDGDGRYTAPGLRQRALTAAGPAAGRVRGKRTPPSQVPSLARIFGLFDCGHAH